jgi:hypothetical protein
MDAKLKKKWLNALRSGKYKQGKNSLRQPGFASDSEKDRFCCLGVLCDIVEPKKWKKHVSNLGPSWTHCGKEEMPNDDLIKKFGLDNLWSRSDTDSVAIKVAEMNDNGRSFEQIANWLEKREF